ncbi:ferredoxin [Rhizobium tubonense]|nr:ferredoxin [Rhizobium tubonense]
MRGTVGFADGETAPALASGARAESIVLLGNIGGSIWEPFSQWHAVPGNSKRHDPLDDWSKAIIRPLAETLGATAYFPSDTPWQPFQRWAMKAEELKPSPLGILIHPEYGLWHGYRGALGFAFRLERQPAPTSTSHPCDACRDKPCLTRCPVGAVTPAVFDLETCRSHLRTAIGQAGCMSGGCLARNACPVGAAHRYSGEQLAFHMAALNL